MPRFRNEADASDIISTPHRKDDGKKDLRRKIVQDGKTYLRIPKPKPLSRRERLEAVTSGMQTVASELETVETTLEELISEKDELESTLEGLDPTDDDFETEKAEAEERLEEISGAMDVAREEAQNSFDSLDFGELECLKEEMESWRDNMSGNSMEHLPKYDEVEECFDALECQNDELECLDFDGSTAEASDVREVIDGLENINSELECVNFPGMFS